MDNEPVQSDVEKFNTENLDEQNHKSVINHILSMISTGELKSGELLPGERVLAERFNVGRATIRTALKFLEFIGVIEISVGKRAIVSRKTGSYVFIPMIELLGLMKEDTFQDLFEARRVLETKMAALAAENADEDDLVAMGKALVEIEDDIQHHGSGILGTDNFHLSVYRASKNIFLYQLGIMLQGLMHESRGITLGVARRGPQSLEDHRNIFEAIKKRDASSAAQLMDDHLCQVQKTHNDLKGRKHV